VTHQALVKGVEVKKQLEPITTAKQRGVVLTELFFSLATLGAVVLTGAIGDPKVPPFKGA